MPDHDEFLDLCAGYALGSASDEDRARLEAHLRAGCSMCERALAEMAEATVLMAHGAPPVSPSPGLKKRVLAAAASSTAVSSTAVCSAAVSSATVHSPRGRWNSRAVLGWSLAACFAIVACAGWVQWYRAKTDLARFEERYQRESEWMAVLSSTEAKILDLVRNESATGKLGARAAYDPATQRLVVVFENMTPPAGRDYELWALRDGGPVSLGLIVAEPDGNGIVRLQLAEKLAGATGFAISLEPAGGSPARAGPSGPIVMAGSLK